MKQMQAGKLYWTGIVFNYETKQYDKLGTKFSGQVIGDNNEGKRCVTAKNASENMTFSSSNCCGETKHFICNTQKEVSRHSPGIVQIFFSIIIPNARVSILLFNLLHIKQIIFVLTRKCFLTHLSYRAYVHFAKISIDQRKYVMCCN